MLRDLSIRNLVLIEALDLQFQPGLNVLTGETGAGKSILLDALGFVLGWRGRADLVRQGATEGEVTASFELSAGHPAHGILQDFGLPDDDTLLLRRVNRADGRKQAFVNDRRVTGEVLRTLSETLVELHGQQDDKGLLDPAMHRRLLDGFCGLSSDLRKLSKLWVGMRDTQSRLEAEQAAFAQASQELDFLTHAIEELQKFDPQPGEDTDLDAKRRLMQAASRISEDVARAAEAVSASGAEGQISDSLRWLETAADKADGRLEEPIAALGRALSELAEAEQGIRDLLDHLRFDPTDLESTEERLFALRALARKYQVQPDDLQQECERLIAKRDAIGASEAASQALLRAVEEARDAFDTAAAKISASRRKGAGRLDKAVIAELAPLKMERAIFATEIEHDPEKRTEAGCDRIRFQVATNPGAAAGPINKIASGGELSRFLLALKVCLTGDADDMTMIFDEIDRGVGGATADAIGRRLRKVAEQGQVLVVTHSPQVAALGDHHWMVSKSINRNITLTDVRPLSHAERVDEIARMLSGDTISDEARAAARSLLD